MSIDRFFVRTAMITHPAAAAGYGDSTEPDYDNGTTDTVKCWLDQLSASEDRSPSRDAQISTHLASFPIGTTIDSTDRVTVDGQTFDVEGPPFERWTPSGGHHLEVNLRYTDG